MGWQSDRVKMQLLAQDNVFARILRWFMVHNPSFTSFILVLFHIILCFVL